jgi:hypothetical protein
MTAEEQANRFIDTANPGWRLVNPSAVAAFAGAMAREIRAAEAAAAAGQREADAALLESWAAEAQVAAFEWHALVAHRLRQAAAALRAEGGR